MKIHAIIFLAIAISVQEFSISAAHPPRKQEPQRAMPHPPQSPLRFSLVKGKERQSLEVTYVDAKTIAFKIAKSGTCSRHEQGKARIAGYWWLGAETDENEAGEAIDVQEYIYRKGSKCSISSRIDEGDWPQATIRESTECSPDCPLSESMHLTPN